MQKSRVKCTKKLITFINLVLLRKTIKVNRTINATCTILTEKEESYKHRKNLFISVSRNIFATNSQHYLRVSVIRLFVILTFKMRK